jgi:hypothetical protein
MANYRQIHVSIWKDEWFLDLEPAEKLLFIYLFSNEATSLAGIYKLPMKVIEFETGLSRQFIEDTLSKFQLVGKVLYENGIVWVTNMRRYHETKSAKVQTRILSDIALIPDCPLKIRYLYGMDTSPQLKEDEEKDEKEISLLQSAFINASGISAFSLDDAEIYQALDKQGVTPVDVTNAVRTLQGKKYTIKGPQSIVTTAINIAKQKSQERVKEAIFEEHQ